MTYCEKYNSSYSCHEALWESHCLMVIATNTPWDCAQSVLVITLQSMFYHCISVRGIRRSYGGDSTRRNQAHRGLRHGRGRGGGGADLLPGINQYTACSDKSSQLRWPTGPHTLTHKTILVPHVKTAKSYHCHGSQNTDVSAESQLKADLKETASPWL